jgi:transcriptional regulator with XRE-family HTH domain
MRKIADAYRRDHDLYTSEEIKAIRGKITQQQFADALGVGVASVKRWELGLVQDKGNDRLIREYDRQESLKWRYEINDREALANADSRLSVEVGLCAPAHGPPV